MGLKLEVGKYYRTRDGRKVGPMLIWDDCVDYPWSDHMEDGTDVWNPDGLSCPPDDSPTDIIAEWIDAPTSPVRTVTRKEIVPGVHGDVRIGGTHKDEDGAFIMIAVGHCEPLSPMTPAELRAAIATLTEIADALEDK